MLTPLEMNVGLAALGPAGDCRPLIDVLGQGRGDLYMARCFARLRRMWGQDARSEAHLYEIASSLGLVAKAIKFDGRLDIERAADLVSFIIERGLNMQKPA